MDKKMAATSVWLAIFVFFSLILSKNVTAQVEDITPPNVLVQREME